ncbi:hypothetical protein [Thermococcus sp.]
MSGSVEEGHVKSFTLHWLALEGEHSYLIKLYNLIGGQKFEEDEESGSVSVADSGGRVMVSIENFTCTPREVGLYEWGGDRDVVSCTVEVQSEKQNVQIAPKVVIDGKETFWLDTRMLPDDKLIEMSFDVKFNDRLAQLMYGLEADALSFVKTVEKTQEVCQRRTCYTQVITHYLPENHSISLRVYKAQNFLPTEEILAESIGITITVKNDNYIEKQYGKYIIVNVATPVITSAFTEVAVVYIFGSSAEGVGFIGGAFIGDLVSKGWDWIWGDD